MSYRIRIRRDTLVRWQSNNPTLGLGEMALVYDVTPQRVKFGDGLTPFNNLPYFTLPNATTSSAGLMSSTDKIKLNGISTGAVDINSVIKSLGRTVSEAVRCIYNIPAAGDYTLLNDEAGLKLMEYNRNGYITSSISTSSSLSATVSFIFRSADIIPPNAFKSVSTLKEVHIPSFVHTIGTKAFADTTVTKITCEGMTPPTVQPDSFDGVDLNSVTVYVHKLCQSLYEEDAFWSTVGTIISIE